MQRKPLPWPEAYETEDTSLLSLNLKNLILLTVAILAASWFLTGSGKSTATHKPVPASLQTVNVKLPAASIQPPGQNPNNDTKVILH